MPTIEATQRRLAVAQRQVLALLVVTFALVGFGAWQVIELRQIRDTAYGRCIATARASVVSSEARQVEIEEFRHLGSLTRQSKAFTEQESAERDAAYNRMAVALQRAVGKTLSPSDCEEYR